MWEAEPTLYWRVKRDGKWSYERTRFVIRDGGILCEFPKPPECRPGLLDALESILDSDGVDESE